MQTRRDMRRAAMPPRAANIDRPPLRVIEGGRASPKSISGALLKPRYDPAQADRMLGRMLKRNITGYAAEKALFSVIDLMRMYVDYFKPDNGYGVDRDGWTYVKGGTELKLPTDWSISTQCDLGDAAGLPTGGRVRTSDSGCPAPSYNNSGTGFTQSYYDNFDAYTGSFSRPYYVLYRKQHWPSEASPNRLRVDIWGTLNKPSPDSNVPEIVSSPGVRYTRNAVTRPDKWSFPNPAPSPQLSAASRGRPPAGIREKKLAMNSRALMFVKGVHDTVGETAEWATIISEAAGMRPSDYVRGVSKFENEIKWLLISGGILSIDVSELIPLIIENQIEDFLFGLAGQAGKEASIQLNLTLGIQRGLAL